LSHFEGKCPTFKEARVSRIASALLPANRFHFLSRENVLKKCSRECKRALGKIALWIGLDCIQGIPGKIATSWAKFLSSIPSIKHIEYTSTGANSPRIFAASECLAANFEQKFSKRFIHLFPRVTYDSDFLLRSLSMNEMLSQGGFVFFQVRDWAFFAIFAGTALLSSRVQATTIVPVANPSFETTGSISGNWAHIGAPWTPTTNSQYSVNNGDNITAHDQTWSAYLANTGTITQDLSTSVLAGDTLSISFWGGRAKSGSSVHGGGVGTVTFDVDGTLYTSTFDTTGLAQNSFAEYTFTTQITNSGNLTLMFGKQSAYPFLDLVSNVSVYTPTPEPGTALLVGLTTIGLVRVTRRKKDLRSSER
jgi:hypothetical protein